MKAQCQPSNAQATTCLNHFYQQQRSNRGFDSTGVTFIRQTSRVVQVESCGTAAQFSLKLWSERF